MVKDCALTRMAKDEAAIGIAPRGSAADGAHVGAVLSAAAGADETAADAAGSIGTVVKAAGCAVAEVEATAILTGGASFHLTARLRGGW